MNVQRHPDGKPEIYLPPGFERTGNPMLDAEAEKWAAKAQEFREGIEKAFPEEPLEPEATWEAHNDEDGVYHTHADHVDRFGRPIKFRERNTESNRQVRRSVGIRTPLAVLQAWEESIAQAAQEAMQELVDEYNAAKAEQDELLGTRDATLGGDSEEANATQENQGARG